MASSQPIVKQIQWISIIPQSLLLIFIISVFSWIGVDNPFFFSTITYILIVITTRNTIPKYHRRGMRFFKKGQYDKALLEYQKSYEFFLNHSWIDKYRYIVLLSSSRVSYFEMALLNMAYCYGQIGEGKKSKELYQKTLEKFPDSKMAEASLKFFDSARNT